MSRRYQPAPGSRYEVDYMSPGGQPAKGVFWLCGECDAADDFFMTQNRITLVVKSSGNRNGERPSVYGTNAGRQPVIVNLTVNYWNSFVNLPQIAKQCVEAWQAGAEVMIHCNMGVSRTPGACAAIMWQISRQHMKHTIQEIGVLRDIDREYTSWAIENATVFQEPKFAKMIWHLEDVALDKHLSLRPARQARGMNQRDQFAKALAARTGPAPLPQPGPPPKPAPPSPVGKPPPPALPQQGPLPKPAPPVLDNGTNAVCKPPPPGFGAPVPNAKATAADQAMAAPTPGHLPPPPLPPPPPQRPRLWMIWLHLR